VCSKKIVLGRKSEKGYTRFFFFKFHLKNQISFEKSIENQLKKRNNFINLF